MCGKVPFRKSGHIYYIISVQASQGECMHKVIRLQKLKGQSCYPFLKLDEI